MEHIVQLLQILYTKLFLIDSLLFVGELRLIPCAERFDILLDGLDLFLKILDLLIVHVYFIAGCRNTVIAFFYYSLRFEKLILRTVLLLSVFLKLRL